MHDDLPFRLARRLALPLPGRVAQSRFEPELSFGRHYAPPPIDARSAAVIVLLYPRDGIWHLPLMVRPQTMMDHAGQVSLPGGTIDPGEEPARAALRELEEELGVGCESVQLLGPLSPLYLFVSNFSVLPWIGVVPSTPALRPSPIEVAELLEVPLPYLLDETNLDRHTREFHGLRFTAPHIRWQNHYVWGATSMILGELISLLREL
jgi:8-oxo-dGTP pyrophosphatase MutT (NUDIX family)